MPRGQRERERDHNKPQCIDQSRIHVRWRRLARYLGSGVLTEGRETGRECERERERERDRKITTKSHALIQVASMLGGGGWLGTSDLKN